MLLDLLPVVLVAWLVFHLLRTHVAERYVVDSPSMEPTYHGAPEGGDVVLVDKTRHSAAPFDVVVVRRPEGDGPHLLKRVVARGPGAVLLREGDVFVVDGSSPTPVRVVKDPLEARDQRQTVHRAGPREIAAGALGWLRPSPAWRLLGETLEVRAVPDPELRRALDRAPPGDPVPSHLSLARALDTSFLTATGARLAEGRGWPRDVGLELTLEFDGGVTGVQLVLEVLGERHTVHYGVDGAIHRSVDGEPAGHGCTGPRLAPGPVDLAFGHLDGHLFVTVGEELALWREVDLPVRARPRLKMPDAVAPDANMLRIGVAGAGAARILRLTAFHDVHYPSEDTPFELDEGELFLLGDNAYDSSDSRDRRRAPFELDDVVGHPIAILAPAHRRRLGR